MKICHECKTTDKEVFTEGWKMDLDDEEVFFCDSCVLKEFENWEKEEEEVKNENSRFCENN